MDPILTSYVVGITTNAVFEATIRIKEAQDGHRAEAEIGSTRPQIELARFGKKYQRDYEFLSQLLDEGRLDQAELYGTKLISDIEVDCEHLRPHFTAAVLTLRAHARKKGQA